MPKSKKRKISAHPATEAEIVAASTVKRQWFLTVLIAVGAIGGTLYWLAPSSDGAQVKVEVPTLTGAAVQGEGLFGKNCASCHGDNAAGSRQGPPLVHKVYEPNHHGDRAFFAAVGRGVRQHHWNFGNMPPVRSVSTTDVTSIIAYVRALQRANGIR
jgi:mono/diheme cytochrome c family protein